MRRVGVAALLGVCVALGITDPASAHVHVVGTGVVQGGEGVLTFEVPTESDTASTTQVTVTFPKDTPIAEVSPQPVPGWTATVQQGTLPTPIQTDDGPVSDYAESVTWQADSTASGIRPGEFQQFAVSAGPLPEVASIVLPTLQTYSDGTTVNWNEQSATGGAEPEHPAPVLDLPATAGDQSSAGARSTAEPAAADSADSETTWPGWAGLAAGVVALVVAGVALARTRPRAR